MQKKIILSIQDIKDNPTLKSKIGGKFYGLCEAADIVDEISSQSGIQFRIPQSWVISSKVFDTIKPPKGVDVEQYFDNLVIPENVINECKHILVLCGGRIALRSSSNIEDGHCDTEEKSETSYQIKKPRIKTYSGAFDTLLDVKVSDIREGLKTIYKSLYNPIVMNGHTDTENLKMSIIIQEMISKPKLSGVIYSKAFENVGDGADAANSIIHYMENSTAERMISDGYGGKIRKIPKFVAWEDGQNFSFCGCSELEKSDAYNALCRNVKHTYNNKTVDYERAFNELAFRQLSSIVNHFEQKLKHPIDMEFAITANSETGMPVINLLQQRPYWEVENFKIRNFNDRMITGFDKNKGPELSGEVVVVDAPEPMRKDFEQLVTPDVSGKIILMRRLSLADMQKNYPDVQESDYDFYMARTTMLYEHLVGNEIYRDATAIVDTTGYLMNAIYSHYGNELHHNGVPFVITSKNDYDGLESGDEIFLNVADGKFKLKKHKNKILKDKNTENRIKLASFSEFWKNKKTRK